MKRIKKIVIKFNINLSELPDNYATFISDKCQLHLVDNIHDGFFITKILEHSILTDKKINLNGSIAVTVICKCLIIDPIIDSVVNIKINDINKMGYSHKQKHLCIFLPIHLCNQMYTLDQNVKIKLIGKRVEEDIVCIGQPI
mgnify:CR=1 FL=1